MSRAVALVCILAAGVAGFFAGRVTSDPGRADDRSGYTDARKTRRLVEMPQDEYEVVSRRAARAHTLEEENQRLREQLKALRPPEEPELQPGQRRPDGTIVGGARWNPTFVALATGFLDSFLTNFVKEAELTAAQEQRVRDEIRTRTPHFAQIMADFVNDDASGDDVYTRLETMAADSRKLVRELLDDDQYRIYQRFEGTVKDVINDQIVHNEMATLKRDLRLDADQEKKILALVEKRYRLVQDRITVMLPNTLLKPIRAGRDKDIYDQTGQAIRELLRADQATAFDRFEKQAPALPHQFRNMLVPKTR